MTKQQLEDEINHRNLVGGDWGVAKHFLLMALETKEQCKLQILFCVTRLTTSHPLQVNRELTILGRERRPRFHKTKGYFSLNDFLHSDASLA